MTHTTLITPQQINALSKPVLFIDCRFSSADPEAGRNEYQTAHIPGAVYANLNHDLSDPHIKGSTGRHPLPSPEKAAATFRRLGVNPDQQVVVYDNHGGAMASRAWWMLHWLGHPATACLDGGWKAWTTDGNPTESGSNQPRPGTFQATPNPEMIADLDRVQQARESDDQILIDSRASGRYAGEHEPLDPIAGHIPGAINLPFADNLDSNGRFKSKEQLKARFETALSSNPEDVVVYCGSGVTAAHNLLAMAHVGIHGARLYVGSWSHWITDPNRPIGKAQ